jgi:transposase
MDIVDAYRQVGSYRGAAAICGTSHKTVRRVIEAWRAGEPPPSRRRRRRARNTDAVATLVADRVAATKGRITAKRLLGEARVAGYVGSGRNFRRVVAAAKRRWRAANHGGRRPGVWHPGQHLLIDWGVQNGVHVFSAVLAWSRWRFVRFAADERAGTTLGLLEECFEAMGGVPAVVLADRMGCLKGGVVAGVVVPAPAYVRFATHFGFRPDFCQPADPESKGMVENLVGYAKSDLMVPAEPIVDLEAANEGARGWCDEVNSAVHSEICAVPAERLVAEREVLRPLPSLRAWVGRGVARKVDKLSTVRVGSARYSVPLALVGRTVMVEVAGGRVRVFDGAALVADHPLVAPGEASITDDHYGRARPAPRRPVRPKTDAEKALCALGEVGERFIKAGAAAGVTTLAKEVAGIVELEAAYGRQELAAALERAVAFGRFKAADVRSILAAGKGVAEPAAPGGALILDLPAGARRDLADYRTQDLA